MFLERQSDERMSFIEAEVQRNLHFMKQQQVFRQSPRATHPSFRKMNIQPDFATMVNATELEMYLICFLAKRSHPTTARKKLIKTLPPVSLKKTMVIMQFNRKRDAIMELVLQDSAAVDSAMTNILEGLLQVTGPWKLAETCWRNELDASTEIVRQYTVRTVNVLTYRRAG